MQIWGGGGGSSSLPPPLLFQPSFYWRGHRVGTAHFTGPALTAMFSDLRRILIGDGEPLLWFNRHKIQSESISLTSEAGKNKQKKLFIYTILTQEELWASQIILTFQLDFLLFLRSWLASPSKSMKVTIRLQVEKQSECTVVKVIPMWYFPQWSSSMPEEIWSLHHQFPASVLLRLCKTRF